MLWLRFDEEAAECPACASPAIVPLDVFSIPRDPLTRRRVAFLTGCRGCGLIFANPLPTAEQLRRFYSDDGVWAAPHLPRTQRLARIRARRLRRKKPPKKLGRPPRALDLLMDALAPVVPVHDPPPGARVLDYGCGDGKLLDRLQDRGWETFGIEPSTDVAFLRHCRLESPPQDGRFDFVILHHVLEHIAEPLSLLSRLARSVRNGGVLFVSVPRLDTLGRHRDFHYCLNGRTHLVAFSERCLTGLLARAGFEVGGTLDHAALDEAQTEGQPLRLRIVARRTTASVPLPAAPLEPARAALRQYASGSGGLNPSTWRWLPVRLRAALVDRARERSAPRNANR